MTVTIEMALECAGASEVRVEVYLCRDKARLLSKVLRPRSLVVVGGRSSWWRSREQKLAKALERRGHRVVFVAHPSVMRGPEAS